MTSWSDPNNQVGKLWHSFLKTLFLLRMIIYLDTIIIYASNLLLWPNYSQHKTCPAKQLKEPLETLYQCAKIIVQSMYMVKVNITKHDCTRVICHI